MADPQLIAVFIENVKEGSLLIHSEIIVPATVAFFGNVPPVLLGVAMAGASLGGLSSWLLGRLGGEFRKKRPEFLQDKPYNRISLVVKQAGWVLAMFYWLPLGGRLLPLLAGFFGARWWQVMLACAVGRLWHHWHGYF